MEVFMVTMEQIKRGAARYVDEEFTAKLSGWQKWAVGAYAAMALENLDGMFLKLGDKPAVRAMGVIDEAGNVDLDRVYTCVKKQAQKGPVTFQAPLLGAVTINELDVDKLYTCILQA